LAPFQACQYFISYRLRCRKYHHHHHHHHHLDHDDVTISLSWRHC